MYYCLLILIVLTALLILRGLIAIFRDPWAPEKNQVVLSKLLPLIGVPSGALFMIPTCILFFSERDLWLSFGFLCFCWLCCSLIAGYLNCRITFTDTEFTVKNFLGFKRTYTYTQIVKFRHTPNHDWVYIGRRRVLVDALAMNGVEFLAHARKRYRIHTGGKSIPKADRPKWDIFKGNVSSPGELIFAFLLIYGVLLVVFIILLFYGAPKTAEDLEFVTITPIHCQVDADKLYIDADSSGQYCRYRISPFRDLLSDPDALLTLCREKAPLTLGVQYISTADDPYYKVFSITDGNGNTLLSLETYNQITQGTLRIVAYMFLGMLALWTVVVAMTILVGRNPQKFPAWFIHLFIKPSYITIPPQNQHRRRR